MLHRLSGMDAPALYNCDTNKDCFIEKKQETDTDIDIKLIGK